MYLEEHIKQCIIKYPISYISKSYQQSRLLILNQIFLVLGNGYEWAYTTNPSQGGYPTCPRYNTKGDRIKDKPYGKTKFEINIDKYFTEKYIEVVNYKKFRDTIFKGFMSDCDPKILSADGNIVIKSNNRPYNFLMPYPFCEEYWLFAEIDHNLIQDDWREGMIDVKKAALEFYEKNYLLLDGKYIQHYLPKEDDRLNRIQILKNTIKILEH